jgi:signal transduction histidine kinase
MSEPSSRSPDEGHSDRGLFVALVIVSYVITFAGPLSVVTPLRIGILIAAGVIYTLVGLFVTPYVDRSGPPLALLVIYFAVQLVLGGVIVYLSEGSGLLIMLPLAAQGIETLPRGGAIVSCVLIVLAVTVPVALLLTGTLGPDGRPIYPLFSEPFWERMLPYTLEYLLALSFVILYTLAAVRERNARTEVERLAAELRSANRQLREYAVQAGELATLKERTRLAREIHDGLGHYLTGINMQIQAGRAVLDHDRDVALDALDQAQALAQEGLTEVRRSVAALRASPLDNQSLPQAVEDLVNECRAAGIATGFTVSGEARDLPPQIELALYRAAQEGMTNMRKYAQASSAEVVLNYQDQERVRLTVSDTGVGTDDPSGGYGLVGIRERVQMLGGTMRIETTPREGFALEIEVPATLA